MKNERLDKEKNPMLASSHIDEQKLGIPAKILGVICILQGAVSIPLLFTYISPFVLEVFSGASDKQTVTSLIMYIIFLVSLLLMIIGLIFIGACIIRNKRRLAAIITSFTILFIVLALISDITLVGIKLTTVLLLVGAIILIVLQMYIDPTLSQERKLQKKLKRMETRKDAEEGMLGLDKTGKYFADINYFNVLWIFVLCSIAGYFGEIIWHMTVDDPGVFQERAGFLFGPFCPIYGLGGIILVFISNKIYKLNVVWIFLICAILGGIFEYSCSLFLEYAFGIQSWDYSQIPFNINGRVSLSFMFIWGLFSTIFVKLVFKPLIRLINKIPWKWRYSLTIIMSIIVWVNAIMTLQALDCWYERLAGKEMNTPIEQFYNTYFDDEFMHARFENMEIDPDKATRLI